MIEASSIVAVIAVGIMFPVMVVAYNLIEFEEGTVGLVDIVDSWLKSWRPLTLAVVGAAIVCGFVELFVYNATDIKAVQWEVALSAVLICAWADAKDHIIPNKVVLLTVIAAVAVCLFQVLVFAMPWNVVIFAALGGVALGGGVFTASRLITRGGVGYGDVKLFAALGLLLGFQVLFNVLLYALVVAFLYGIGLLLFRKKKINDRLPLGPFALVGTLVSIGFGV